MVKHGKRKRRHYGARRVLFLELGVGEMTPGVTKLPF